MTTAAAPPAAPLSTLGFYWRVAVQPHLGATSAILGLTLGTALLDVVTIGLTVPLLDVLTASAEGQQSPVVRAASAALQALGLTPTASHVTLTLLVVASLAFLIRSAAYLLAQCGTGVVAVKLRRVTKTRLFERVLRARYEEVSKRARGLVVTDINAPPEALAGAITQLSNLLTGLVTTAFMVALLVSLSWWATILIGLLAIGGIQGWRWYAGRRSALQGQTLYQLRAEQNKLQVDAVDGLKVVKAHGLERRLVARQDALLSAELTPELQLIVLSHGPTLVNELVAVAIVVGLGAVTFLIPAWGLRFSMLAAFLLAIRRIAPALAMVNLASVNLGRHTRELEVMEEITRHLPQERRGGRSVERAEEIRFDAVSFAYAARPETAVLQGITAAMRRGTVTAIVGPTGAGKSTVAALVLGLYEPRAGTVQVNGTDLRTLDLSAWREHIGYVTQDVFLFNATIRDNMTLGDETVPEERVAWAAGVAQLDRFIRSLPEGYDTVVGDRGLRLSGGQCQRLAIARAVLRKPDVLIFDEATSALDHVTERAVYDAISVLRREAMAIVIAHRLSTVKQAEQILVLEAGRVVERGTHAALMRQGGVYATLYTTEDRQRTSDEEPKALPPSEALAGR